MRTRAPATPVWVKAIRRCVGAVGVPAWWLADRQDRVANAGPARARSPRRSPGARSSVRCPGPIGRCSAAGTSSRGSVRVRRRGQRRATRRKLRKTTCAELDALADGRARATQLALRGALALAAATARRRSRGRSTRSRTRRSTCAGSSTRRVTECHVAADDGLDGAAARGDRRAGAAASRACTTRRTSGQMPAQLPALGGCARRRAARPAPGRPVWPWAPTRAAARATRRRCRRACARAGSPAPSRSRPRSRSGDAAHLHHLVRAHERGVDHVLDPRRRPPSSATQLARPTRCGPSRRCRSPGSPRSASSR